MCCICCFCSGYGRDACVAIRKVQLWECLVMELIKKASKLKLTTLAMILLAGKALLIVTRSGAIAGATGANQVPATGIAAQPQQQGRTPLENLLNADGTLNSNLDFTGSVDPSGWRMEADPDGQPRFVRSGDKQAGKQASAN